MISVGRRVSDTDRFFGCVTITVHLLSVDADVLLASVHSQIKKCTIILYHIICEVYNASYLGVY